MALAEVVSIRPVESEVIDLLEEALAKARAGEVIDIAIVTAVRDENGPQHWFCWYGERGYSSLVAGTAALAFDLQYRRKHDEY